MLSQHAEKAACSAAPQSVSRDDLSARLERTIRSRTGGHVRNLHVEVTEAGVILSGIASTYYAKQLATHAALDELSGIAVHNAIEVV